MVRIHGFSKLGGGLRQLPSVFKQGVNMTFHKLRDVSHMIGSFENKVDSMLKKFSSMPVIRRAAEYIQQNPTYKAVRGTVDDIRGIIDSDYLEDIVNKIDDILTPIGGVSGKPGFMPPGRPIFRPLPAPVSQGFEGSPPKSSFSGVATS